MVRLCIFFKVMKAGLKHQCITFVLKYIIVFYVLAAIHIKETTNTYYKINLKIK